MRLVILACSLLALAACGDFSTTIRPTAVTIRADRTSAPVGQPFRIFYEAQGRSLAGLVIEYGDISNPDSVHMQGAVTATGYKDHTYAQPGTYVVIGTLEEFLGGQATSSVTLTVTGGQE